MQSLIVPLQCCLGAWQAHITSIISLPGVTASVVYVQCKLNVGHDLFVQLYIIHKLVLLFIDFMYFTRWPYKLVHPFVCLFSELAPYFSDFLHEVENLFLPRFGKKEPQNRVFRFFNFFSICFSKQQCKMRFLVILVFPLQTSCPANFFF